ncbi:hypothetical protein Gotri_017536 [Gossypium trilobum]|uniref:alpha,alpha-trehalase n=1 Tax=Gossypium trilobum TaxID=34281 RepID=A0A7J9E6V0_9ROSI|nr:hypothetical protein [Gossypium trilobum]
MAAANHSPSSPYSCAKDSVIPTTSLVTFLERVQETAFQTYEKSKFDHKDFIDLSLKFDLSTTVKAFDEISKTENGSVSTKDFEEFIGKWFKSAGEDLVYVEPMDFETEPYGFLPKVENPEVRAWALEVHGLWKKLSREVSSSVHDHPELHTLLPLPVPGMIPGSRFREVYYWDSYWVIRGLLASKMHETAKAIVTNLISLLDTYGYVLNGARAYYTNRRLVVEGDALTAIKSIRNREVLQAVRKDWIAWGRKSQVLRGTPQIEVTFEVDANGILNVKAEDKGTGKSEKITITNDKGRLSQEEIERMVREAEEFAEEDKKVKEKIDARNSLETYVYNMKNQINDKDKLADKLESDEKEKVETAVKEALEWLDDNQNAEKEDFEEKLKEVEAVCNPIITAVYQRSGGGPGGAASNEEEDDSHDEL